MQKDLAALAKLLTTPPRGSDRADLEVHKEAIKDCLLEWYVVDAVFNPYANAADHWTRAARFGYVVHARIRQSTPARVLPSILFRV
jgi:hypothetical protein